MGIKINHTSHKYSVSISIAYLDGRENIRNVMSYGQQSASIAFLGADEVVKLFFYPLGIL